MAGIRKNDVGGRKESVGELGRHSCLNYAVPRLIDAHANHGDQDGGDDGHEGGNGLVRYVLERSWERTGQGDEETDEAEDDGAGAVLRDGIHHDAEGQDVRTHEEDDEEHLRDAKDFASDWTKQDLTGICHIVDLWMRQFELANDIARVCCQNTKAEDEDDAAGCYQDCIISL